MWGDESAPIRIEEYRDEDDEDGIDKKTKEENDEDDNDTNPDGTEKKTDEEHEGVEGRKKRPHGVPFERWPLATPEEIGDGSNLVGLLPEGHRNCRGCGVPLQHDFVDRLGFVDPVALRKHLQQRGRLPLPEPSADDAGIIELERQIAMAGLGSADEARVKGEDLVRRLRGSVAPDPDAVAATAAAVPEADAPPATAAAAEEPWRPATGQERSKRDREQRSRLMWDSSTSALLRQLEMQNALDNEDREMVKLLTQAGEQREPPLPPRQGGTAPAPRNLTCQRCYHLDHYGASRGTPEVATSEEVFGLLEERLGAPDRSAVIVMMYDLFDFHGSHLPNLHRLVGRYGRNPLILVGNKFDLLPAGVSEVRVRSWLVRQARDLGLKPHAVHLVSAKKGDGVRGLLRRARDLATKVNMSRRSETRRERAAIAQHRAHRLTAARTAEDGNGAAELSPPAVPLPARTPAVLPEIRDIYIVGSANSGKSTLINSMLKQRLIMRRGAQRVTSSVLPGTTLGLVSFPIFTYDDVTQGPEKVRSLPRDVRVTNLFDTPGLVNPQQLITFLRVDELEAVVPQTRVRPVSYRLEPGQSMLLGGLARLDLEGPRPVFFTAVVASGVTVHVTRTDRVAEVLETSLGTRPEVLSPPFTVERAAEIGLTATSPSRVYELPLQGWLQAASDVVFPGLGWVVVTGAGVVTVRAFPCRSTGTVFVRDPLMPYEARSSVRRFSGSGVRR